MNNFYKNQVEETIGQAFSSQPQDQEAARLLFENFKVENNQSETESEPDNENFSAKEVISNLTSNQIREFLSVEQPWWEKQANELPILKDIPKINTDKANNKHMGALLVNSVFTYAFLTRWYRYLAKKINS